MTYCLNSNCPNPSNPPNTKFCLTCGAKLLLRDRYRAVQPLGQGGMGRTFFAVDEDRLNAPCVIKQFFPQIQGTAALAKATELFQREAVQLLHLGEHPQIPSLYAYFEQDKRWYLVQELIDGPDLLNELKQQGAFSENQIKSLLLDLLPVLQFIHDNHVIHRDIKPENILRRRKDNKLVLVDFGVAKEGTGTALAQMGTRAGTHGYAPLEQIRGGQAYPASDLYSLGVTCIQLLTAKMPDDLYDGMNARWVWKEQLAKQGKSTSPILAQILDKLLQELVRDRYQSATEVLQVLQPGAIASPPPNPVPSPPLKPPAAPKTPPSTRVQPGKFDPVSVDLAAIKTHFSQGQPGNAPPPKPSTTPPPKTPGFDPIADELEALRSEFGQEP
ncbi:serine/threonine protein kinase [Phormidium pseudopriestleyi FRX01]|uniref:non-specific serine/threonine protein kinase n=1 Tax=Phormidium pseudopriestleyi FRX01 TaxID=1759528 RepID=A0ABS3FPF5_9CYAN|nr:serine/threonine-protein kinase [Phormidium pseudopriestleyi]MBO0348928.1 serine/threonine protein kinase [Phormidium pseudopriestleyi FRX01]